MKWLLDDLILTDEQQPNSVDQTFQLLQETYWAKHRPYHVVERMMEQSLCFFLLKGDEQIGFARVISDFTTTSWICDVAVATAFQNRGVGSSLMKCLLKHPSISDTHFVLQTSNAHAFYERFGFNRNEALMSTPVDYL